MTVARKIGNRDKNSLNQQAAWKFDPNDDLFYGPPIEIPFMLGLLNSIGSTIVLFFSYARAYFSRLFLSTEDTSYVPLFNSFETIYKRFYYARALDCFAAPVTSMASTTITLKEQKLICRRNEYALELTGKRKTLINLGSYNYLGMNQTEGPIANSVEQCIRTYGVSTYASRAELGEMTYHRKLEKLFASFLSVDDCITFGMGFATNSLNLAPLLGPNCLVLSDEKNHASISNGCKGCTKSVKRIFKHNDMNDLEKKLREAIVRGNPVLNRPWRKIVVIVEGIYSMEGTICKLPALMQLKKKYKFYLYLDEAHSIGAIGHSGRGVCQLFDVPTSQVDILMGTFTKSFAASGGYIAGSKRLIDYLRTNSPGCVYATSMSPVIVEQIISSLRIIMHPIEGAVKARNLAHNVAYFRHKLEQRRLVAIGSPISPVIPIIIVGPGTLAYVQRALLSRGVGVVIAGFPATEFNQERMRLCLSSDHTRKMLDHALSEIFQLADRGILPVKNS